MQPVAPNGRKALLAGWLYVPLEALGSRQRLDQIRADLTFTPRFAETGEDVIFMYSLGLKGYIGVPRAWGIERFGALPIEDRLSLGGTFEAPSRPDPNHPAVLDPAAQAQFMADMLAAARTYRSFVAVAPTGSGKTTVALNTAAELGRSTLILVHLERLMHQWIEEIQKKLGVPRDQIGVIQSDCCQADRPICVAMLHSLCQRRYDREVYRRFGTVIVDECHKIGSKAFSRAVTLFPSYYRIGLSATPHRRDGGDAVIFAHLGPIRVKSRATALTGTVETVRYRGPALPFLRNTSNSSLLVKGLVGDHARNLLLTEQIVRLWRDRRQILVVGHQVGHLQHLVALCAASGIPAEVMGQFTADRHKMPEDFDWAQPYRPPRRATDVKKERIPTEELERVKRESQIIFATYGMISEGIDIPRLDAGIDVTPRSSAIQVIGRIRRPLPGKREPLWVTVVDASYPVALGMYKRRLGDYLKSGMKVRDHG